MDAPAPLPPDDSDPALDEDDLEPGDLDALDDDDLVLDDDVLAEELGGGLDDDDDDLALGGLDDEEF